MNVHPRYTAAAERWMRNAGGDPDGAGDLARWLQIAHYGRLYDRGVIIGQDGTLLAETRVWGRAPGPRYHHTMLSDMQSLTGQPWPTEAGMATGAISRAVGQRTVHVTYSAIARHLDPTVR